MKCVSLVLSGLLLVVLAGCGGSDSGTINALRGHLETTQEQLETTQKQLETTQKEAEEQAQQDAEAREAAQQQAQQDAEAREAAQQQAQQDAEAREAAQQQAQQAEEQRQAAEQERQRLAEKAAKAQQAASRAQAKAAFDALGGQPDSGTRSNPGTVTVTPRYGQTAMVTTAPSVVFGSTRRSSSGRWSVTTLSNAGSTHNDDLIVYSDLGGPTSQPIGDEYTSFAVISSGDVTDTMFVAGDVNKIRITVVGASHAELISSPNHFPKGANSKTFPDNFDGRDTDSDNDRVRIPGYFDGASGTFECSGTCTIQHLGGNTYSVGSSSWIFITSATARVSVPDDSYMYFGWWKREQKSDESLSFEMFSGGMYEVDGATAALTGTATYTGPAVGQYAIYQPLGTQTESGSFTARAELTANFGATGAEGTLSGRVTNFSNASDWSVTLKSAAIDTGTVANGDVSWTIAGNTEDSGMWNAQFFSDVDRSTAYPEGVAGTFDAKFDTVGRLIGAFGAHCPTSTCPRN